MSTKACKARDTTEKRTFLVSNCASSWQHPLQTGSSWSRLNCPRRSQELQSKLLEKPNSLHASDDNSAPRADTWKWKQRIKHSSKCEKMELLILNIMETRCCFMGVKFLSTLDSTALYIWFIVAALLFFFFLETILYSPEWLWTRYML